MEKVGEEKKKEKSPSLGCISSTFTVSHALYLSAYLSTSLHPKIRQIYFNVNRVEYNWCWLKRNKKKRENKKKECITRSLRKIYQNYFCVKGEM